jgi:hypothetical protein
MESAAELVQGPLNLLASLYDKKGNPVSNEEIESVRRGTWYEGEPKGLYLTLVIPSKEPIGTSVTTANAISKNPYLTDEEKRNASLNLLGSLLTAPSGARGEPKPKRAPRKAATVAAPDNQPETKLATDEPATAT